MTTAVAVSLTAYLRQHLDRAFGPPALEWESDVQPVPLHRARVVFAGGRTHAYNESKDKAYRDELQLLWRAARLRPLSGDLVVLMAFAGKGRTRPDASNLLKAVEDAGNAFLWGDDAQIVSAIPVVERWGKGTRPRLGVWVWRVEDWRLAG